MTMRQIEITDIGAIVHLEIPIPEDGGVVVLRGRNGVGKTTALNAASSLMDGETELSVRDGAEKGSVIGLGCEIHVKKRTARAGTLEVSKIAGEDIGLFVNPRVKDPAAGNKVRLRVLCRLARVKNERAQFASIEAIAGMSLPITLGEDLPESAAKTKRAIEFKAREVEEAVGREEGTVQGLLRNAAAIDLESPHDEALLGKALEKAIRELASVEGEASACHRAAQEAERARAALDMAKEGYKGPTLEEARKAAGVALKEEVEAQAALRDAQEAKRAADALLRAVTELQEAVAGWEATIAKAENAFGVSEDQLDGLRRTVREAEVAKDRGVLVRQALQQKKEAEEANAALAAKRTEAGNLRAAAAACDKIVSEAISSVAPRGLKVVNGVLMVSHRRGEIPVDELSEGERWAMTIDIGVDAVGPNGLLSISQEAWQGLDQEHKDFVAKHARTRRATILTAAQSMDDLTAEVIT